MRDLFSHAATLISPHVATSGRNAAAWDLLSHLFGWTPPLWGRVVLVAAFFVLLGAWIWSLVRERGDDE